MIKLRKSSREQRKKCNEITKENYETIRTQFKEFQHPNKENPRKTEQRKMEESK